MTGLLEVVVAWLWVLVHGLDDEGTRFGWMPDDAYQPVSLKERE